MKIKIILILILYSTIASSNELIFAIGKWTPYTGKDEVEYGTTTQKIKMICNKANIKCKFEFVPWKRAFHLVKSGKYDGTFPWELTKETKNYFIVSPVIEKTKVVAFSFKQLPKELKDNHKLFDFYKVVGVNGYVFPEILKKEGAQIHMVKNSQSAWNMLKHKRIDGYIDDILVGKDECRAFTPSICNRLKISEPLFVSDMHILFTKQAKSNKSIEKFLKHMK